MNSLINEWLSMTNDLKEISFSALFFVYLFFGCTECGISVPQPGIKPSLTAFEAQSFLEAQYVWKSVQRSSLFRAEAEVGSSKKKSTGVLTWRGVNRGSLVCEYGLNLPRLRWE